MGIADPICQYCIQCIHLIHHPAVHFLHSIRLWSHCTGMDKTDPCQTPWNDSTYCHGCTGRHEQIFPRAGVCRFLCRDSVQHRVSYYWFPVSHRFRIVYRASQYGSLSSAYRFYSHSLISLTEGCGYRREFLVDIILRLPCVLHRTNYTRRSDCTESYGKNHRIESCYHFIIPLRLGGINGNCRYDYRFALYQLDAFLLSKIHTNKRKRIFRRDRTHWFSAQREF